VICVAAGAVLALVFGGTALADQGSSVAIHPGAHTSFDRTWNWVVTKSDDQHSAVTIAQNEVFSVGYTITVSNGNPAYTDSNWQVQDGIPFATGDPAGFTLNSSAAVTAAASQDGGTVSTQGAIGVCSTDSLYLNAVTFPFTGLSLLCHYVIPLPDGTPGTVAAAATFSDGSKASGSTPFDFVTGGANLEPGQPVVSAASVNIVDSQAGQLGSLTAPVDALHPQVFTYSVQVPSATCGSFDLPNTVNLIDPQTGLSVARATDTVHVTVTCPHVNGCTLTQGYWKTHSIYGPAAKPDPTWNLLSNGPNTTFFSSGQTWLQVFNTAPKGGNAYYVLAHQYMAAVLNQLDGASATPTVTSALSAAVSFFNTYTPAQAGALASNSAARQAALANAATLDNYNSGLIGPGHCGENS
jgi:hypothetical protein